MTSADRIRIKHNIDQASAVREGRAAVHIAESIRSAFDLIDAQPAAVLEVLIERGKLLQKSGNAPKHTYKVRAVLIEYLEVADCAAEIARLRG
jgi:hypothetical protein